MRRAYFFDFLLAKVVLKENAGGSDRRARCGVPVSGKKQRFSVRDTLHETEKAEEPEKAEEAEASPAPAANK